MRYDEDSGSPFYWELYNLIPLDRLHRPVLLFPELHQHIQKKNDGQSIQDGKYYYGHLSPSGALAR